MPPQHDTLEYDPQAVSKFLSLSPDKQDEVFGNLSSGAQQALLLGLRTLRQSKVSGATTPTNIPEVGPSSGKAGTTYRPTGGFVRVPTIGEATESFGQSALTGAQETLPGVAKGVGAGIGAAVAPEAILPEFLGAFIGGAAGEATEQLTKRATGLGEVPEDSTEAALGLAKAGAETGLFQLGFRGLEEAYRGLSKYFDPLVFGQEGIFRAAGPTGDPQFFDNVRTSSYDLANIYRRTEGQIRDARGGFLNADHRYRATIKGIDDYLKEMYQTERKGQIDVAAQYGSRVTIPGNANEIQFMGRWLSKQLPIDSPALAAAQRLAENPLAPIPIQEADALAIAVNSYDLKTAIDRATSKVLSGKNAIDQGLKRGINDKLREVGQPGIESYERRYAALSRVKEALEGKMNKVQAQRTSDRLRAFFSLHGLYARGSVESLEPPGGALEESLKKLTKAQEKGMIPEPRSSRAIPPRIFQGEAVPPEEGLATTPPRAGEVPPGGRGGGMAPPPQFIDVPPRGEPRLLPEQTERRAPMGRGYEPPHPEYEVSPPGSGARKTIDEFEKSKDVASLRKAYESAIRVGDRQDAKYASQALGRLGAERRTIPFAEAKVTGPSPMRTALMKDIQDKINLLEKDDPVRKVLQDRLDDLKAHPFERAGEESDIHKVRAKTQKKMTREEAEAEHAKRHMKPPPKPDEPNF